MSSSPIVCLSTLINRQRDRGDILFFLDTTTPWDPIPQYSKPFLSLGAGGGLMAFSSWGDCGMLSYQNDDSSSFTPLAPVPFLSLSLQRKCCQYLYIYPYRFSPFGVSSLMLTLYWSQHIYRAPRLPSLETRMVARRGSSSHIHLGGVTFCPFLPISPFRKKYSSTNLWVLLCPKRPNSLRWTTMRPP